MVSRLVDRGSEVIRVYPAVPRVDPDGNEVLFPGDEFYERRVTVAEDRQADAELTGQVTNKVVRITARDLPGIDSWAEIWFRGEQWDLASPPHFSNGVSRAIKHVEIALRSRNSIPRRDDG